MSAAAATITNEDLMGVIQDLMQMTSEGFERLENRMDRLVGRMDHLENRMDGVEGHMERLDSRLSNVEIELREIKSRLSEHDLQFAELKRITQQLLDNDAAYMNDIADILDRIVRLENRASISPAELRELQRLLDLVVTWAIKAAGVVKVPLKLHS